MFKGLRKAIRPISFSSIWMWSGGISGDHPKVVSILLIYHIYMYRHKSTSIFILISTSLAGYHRGNAGSYIYRYTRNNTYTDIRETIHIQIYEKQYIYINT